MAQPALEYLKFRGRQGEVPDMVIPAVLDMPWERVEVIGDHVERERTTKEHRAPAKQRAFRAIEKQYEDDEPPDRDSYAREAWRVRGHNQWDISRFEQTTHWFRTHDRVERPY